MNKKILQSLAEYGVGEVLAIFTRPNERIDYAFFKTVWLVVGVHVLRTAVFNRAPPSKDYDSRPAV